MRGNDRREWGTGSDPCANRYPTCRARGCGLPEVGGGGFAALATPPPPPPPPSASSPDLFLSQVCVESTDPPRRRVMMVCVCGSGIVYHTSQADSSRLRFLSAHLVLVETPSGEHMLTTPPPPLSLPISPTRSRITTSQEPAQDGVRVCIPLARCSPSRLSSACLRACGKTSGRSLLYV